ncbi:MULTISPECIES: GNAT family protein [unclassified Bacillus (in: firmicutes)]|uniref:GNAT family N-acetyltransferase n=1 Tax=unclassified Bacillus (in: firmicutes) TaxID=185979 RepID=UPI001BE54CF6|nr:MULTISPECIES: GNAT family protein [unclassified Bacillus (in: firmicutes)]MBT2639536.1 GNAT family N-acetyltransferase [Bacillus sp. ISL-39]MBT2662540.1 GNAT family N-acetyltransferase [Bacillus sp. ISL-45]
MDKKVTLEGNTVNLMPMESSQLDGLWGAGQDQSIWEFTSSKVRNKDEMEKVIEAAMAERKKGTQIPFTVLNKKIGKIVGSSRFLDISEPHRSLEIGWTWYSPEYWRTSVNTETKMLMLQYAFEEMGVNRVQFCTDSRNVRSQTAIARLGAQKEGVLRKHRIIADGYVRDTVVFSILKEEWPKVKTGLQEKLNRV